ncbi:MAG: UpxY family transcription antiterminator [Candidatus Acidiferrales bacterium]
MLEQVVEGDERRGLRVVSENVLGTRIESRWYAAYTRSRHEKSVAHLLQRKQVDTFLPLYGTVRRWENGDHRVELPLFPGYTFVRISLVNRLRVLEVPGVVRLVGFGGTPTPLDDEEVESLRQAISSGLNAAPHPYLTIGRRVRITAGALAGREGILVRRKGVVRVVLSIDLIQRSVAVEVDAYSIEPVLNSSVRCSPLQISAGYLTQGDPDSGLRCRTSNG